MSTATQPINLGMFMSAVALLETAAEQAPDWQASAQLQDAAGAWRTVTCKVVVGQAHKYRGAFRREYTLDGRRLGLMAIQDILEGKV